MRNEATRDVWSARLQEQAGSGLGIRPWCVREGVKEPSFHYWRKQLSRSVSPVSQLIALPFPDRQSESMLELQTPHGYVIRFGSQEQIGWLGVLLAALR